jgi:hypothetical protein
VWQRAIGPGGYGKTWDLDSKQLVAAHRLYYERHIGPIPEGLHLDHLCRVRACVNPAHLEAVTCAENLRRGERTKLDPDSVRAIRARVQGGEAQGPVAADFGVAPMTVSSIVTRKNWRDI